MDLEREIRGHSDAVAKIYGSRAVVILICARGSGDVCVWRAKVKLGAKALHQTNWYASPDGALRALSEGGTRLAASSARTNRLTAE